MNLETLTLVAQIAGLLGVIVSVAYLAVQVRQNTLSVRSATYDSLVRHSDDFLLPVTWSTYLEDSPHGRGTRRASQLFRRARRRLGRPPC